MIHQETHPPQPSAAPLPRPQKKLCSGQSQSLVRPDSSVGDHPAALRIEEGQVAVLFAALNFAPLCFKTKWKKDIPFKKQLFMSKVETNIPFKKQLFMRKPKAPLELTNTIKN